MKKLMNITFLAAVTAVGLSSLSLGAYACDFHGQGFGMMGQTTGFGQGHPLMQRHIRETTPAQLRLNHERQVVAKVNEAQSIDIKYFLPTQFKDVSLSFTHSDGVTLKVEDKISIDEINGTYTLNYVTSSDTKQHILVWIDAMKASLPYSKVQRIEISPN